MRLSAWLFILLLTGAGGCSPETRLLVIDVRTDYLAGEEFAAVQVEVMPEVGEPTTARVEDLDAPFEAGVRVLELELSGASALVTASLRDDADGVVMARPVLMDLSTHQVATVLLSRRCEDVTCDAMDQACQLGRCVSARCIEEAPEECAGPECTAASDCTAGPACAIAECTSSGGCFYAPDDGACGTDERCHPTRGCEPAGPGPCDGVTASDPHALGAGTVGDPYLLCTTEQLVTWLGSPGSDVATLGQDVDLTGTTLTPVANPNGTLDGGGHRIVGARVMGDNVTGLFTTLGAGAVVRDLILDDLGVDGTGVVGGLAGSSNGATIEGVRVIGRVTGTGNDVGGLVGVATDTTLSDVHGEIDVTGEDYVGGLVGRLEGGRLERASATGTVTGDPDEGCTLAGGLVGRSQMATVAQSFAAVTVSSGGASIGGLIGWNQDGTVEDCYATGEVTAGRSIADYCSTVNDLALAGGLIGVDYNGVVRRCYATGATNASHLTAAGLIAHSWTTSDLSHNFATGMTMAGTGERGGLYGRANGGMDTGSYWSIPGTGVDRMCAGGPAAACDDSRGVDAPAAATYFFSAANPPLDMWDFNAVWLEQPDGLPILRWQGGS